jgi:C-terminal processing protease CtpA/Prc
MILAVDGKSVAQLGGFGEAIQRIRGAEGTVVVLRVRFAATGEERDLHVTRAPVRGP